MQDEHAQLQNDIRRDAGRIGQENQRIVVLEADLSKTTMTKLFEKEFPGRFFEVGIGEQNMISTAAGLALSGKIAFAIPSRSSPPDGVRPDSCKLYWQLNVKIVAPVAGFRISVMGPRTRAIEDVQSCARSRT